MSANTATDGKGRFKLALLLLFALIAVLLVSDMAFAADIGDGLRNVGGRIGGFFNDYASSEGPTFIDFAIFAIIFFTMCWVGFSAVFKEAKAANIALSISLGLALSLALVYGGKFTVKKLLPFAAIFLFLLLMIGIYALLKKFIFTKDTTASKIFSALFAIIVSIAILAVAWHFICEGDRCESNAFLSKIFGSESIIGKLFGKASDFFEDVGDVGDTTGTTGTGEPLIPGEGPVLPNCGNGIVDTNETCDVGGNGKPDSCDVEHMCNNCNECVPLSSLDVAKKGVMRWWVWGLIILVLGVVLTMLISKRKSLNEKLALWKAKRKKKREFAALAKLLRDTEQNEKAVLTNFKQLCDTVKNEKTTFDAARHIVDGITTDVKETIGGEIEFVKAADMQAGGTIAERLAQLIGFNNTENHIITEPTNGILFHISQQVAKIGQIPKELQKEIDALEKVSEQLKEHESVLRTFGLQDFKEKGVITNLIQKLDENKKSFTEFKDRCTRIVTILNDMQTDIHGIANTNKVDYPTILKHIKSVRDNAIRLNKLFIWKINLLHYLVQRMTEVKGMIEGLHERERANMAAYLEEARRTKDAGLLDSAIYLASHVLENAEYLKSAHLAEASRNAIDQMMADAKGIIRECLPNLFASMKDKIQGELNLGLFDEVKTLVDNIGELRFVEDKHNSAFSGMLNEYEKKMQKLGTLCDKLRTGSTVRTSIYTDLGMTPPVITVP
jgi:rubrerythrin